ncbi:MAG: DnaJ-class molecular chaperone [Rhodoferax sp.]|jgi:DnaJ-class molecular chaperone
MRPDKLAGIINLPMKDHYATLGLNHAATLADVKKAFRQQASRHHPDRNTSAQAPERFRAVQEAYEVLSDDAKRQAYDDNRRRSLLDSPLETAREIWQNYFNPLTQTGTP